MKSKCSSLLPPEPASGLISEPVQSI
jgi:hypothetical protein